MKETVLITGATGLLGSSLLHLLLQKSDCSIAVLSRGRSRTEAESRVIGALSSGNGNLCADKLNVFTGDICKPRLGLSLTDYEDLSRNVTRIYHSAAICDFGVPLDLARKINVGGTKNVIDFAQRCCENGRFEGFHHVSTVAVSGTNSGMFYEDELDINQGFNNAYEQSKFEAECVVKDSARKGMPAVVYRPGIISGHSGTGYTSNLKVFYQPLHLLSLGLFNVIPADRNSYHYITSVDSVAEAIYIISANKDSVNRTFHTINPSGVMLGYFLDLAGKYLNFKVPEMIPLEDFKREELTQIQWALIEPYIPYFNFKNLFDSTNTEAFLKNTDFKWPNVDDGYFSRIFSYCLSSGFIKRRKKGTALQH